ncbi:MAG TPA: hypothetical protein PLE24_11410 [Chitinispirillaceae bacterium]|jgi:tetratricopeptide (TPR) repeat protein|nr:hypothetical protein [Chitinispirillaceae bacterium]
MRKNLLFFFVLLSGISFSTFSESLKDSALTLLVRQDYAGANACIQKHLLKNPDDNTALYFKLAIEQTRILDYESYLIDGEKFIVMVDSIKSVLESRLKKLRGADSLECLFFIANAYGGISIIQAKAGNWFDAMRNAVNSTGMLKQVRKQDPEFYAAYLGIGVFNYYLRNSLKWVPFVDDKGEEGIRAIENAMKADFPYNYAAKNSLCWILIEKDKFRSADSLAISVLKDIPDNTIFLRIRTFIALWTGKNKEAIELAKRLIVLSEKRNPMNWSDLIAGYTVLVNSYSNLKMEKEAFDSAEEILNRQIPREYLQIPHIKKNIRYISDKKQKALKK